MRRLFRWLWPDTLVGRTVLVMLAGLLLAQLAGVVLYSLNRLELTTRLGSRQLAEKLAGIVLIVEGTPDAERGRVIRAVELPGLRIGWGQVPLVAFDDRSREDAAIAEALRRHLKNGEDVRLSSRPPPMPPDMMAGGMQGDHPRPGFGMMRHGHPPLTRVAVNLPDGSWLNFVVDMPPDEPLWRPRFFGPLTAGMLLVMGLSVLAVRRGAKPLAVLAAAAKRLGRDVAAPPVPVEGPREVREAAEAFNEMQTRLRRFIDDRTQMIAAISHDLRTPITRLKLRAEFVEDDEERLKMLSDLDEMESMIASTLAFARDDSAREARKRVDLAQLLASLCDDLDAFYEGPDSFLLLAGQTGLKRAFANLIENARKYAGGSRVRLERTGGEVLVTIEDDGPGIPEMEMERVFAPFYRVESSRNRDTGGTGLGLAVARSAIRAHGGDICLANRSEGGLLVTVTLPGDSVLRQAG